MEILSSKAFIVLPFVANINLVNVVALFFLTTLHIQPTTA